MSDQHHDALDGATDMDEDDLDLDYCADCGESFRYDDCGGYNPPCVCGEHCRSWQADEEANSNGDIA